MAEFTGQNDEQFATGAAIGGVANVLANTTAIGSSATTVASWIGAHCGSLSAVKLGITVGLSPHLGVIALLGGVGYLLYQASR